MNRIDRITPNIRAVALELAVKSMGVATNAGTTEIILTRAASFAYFLSGASGSGAKPSE